MSKWRKKNPGDGIDYWQTVADALAALLLVVLLVLMLVILYLIYTPDNRNIDTELGDRYHDTYNANHSNDNDDGGEDDDGGQKHYDEQNAGGGGGGGSGGNGVQIIPQTGIGNGDTKAAVYVQVIDAETEHLIPEAGVTFELYTPGGAMKVLNTYYPQKVEYRDFKTTEEGTYYLPEKIPLGGYALKELNAPAGYDPAESTAMSITQPYDWPEPYVAKIRLYPSKNIIRVLAKDSVNGKGVEGGSYEVVAAEDIKTRDGTLRYKKGEVVDTIRCAEDGTGESMELYLGRYELRQTEAAQYYAAAEETNTVQVEKKNGQALPDAQEYACERTTVTVKVLDELYEETPITHAGFILTNEKDSGFRENLETDENGTIVLKDLEKETTYRMKQTSTEEGYTFDAEAFAFTVDETGRIEDSAMYEQTVVNRMLRVSIGVHDRILHRQVSDTSMTLMNAGGQVVETWDSSGMMHVIEGLEEGEYFVRVGNWEEMKRIAVKDQAELQTFSYGVWTTMGLAVCAILVLAGIILLTAAALYLRRRAWNRTAGQKRMKEGEQDAE